MKAEPRVRVSAILRWKGSVLLCRHEKPGKEYWLLPGGGVNGGESLVDSGYRGELRVVLLNTDATEPFVVERGMRIAQLVVLPIPELELVEVDQLPSSERGVRGFGSSAT